MHQTPYSVVTLVEALTSRTLFAGKRANASAAHFGIVITLKQHESAVPYVRSKRQRSQDRNNFIIHCNLAVKLTDERARQEARRHAFGLFSRMPGQFRCKI
jgi:hypothetical protein